MNKIDKVTPAEADRLKQLFEASTSADAVLPTCALTGAGVSSVREWAISRIPEGPSFYPKASFSACHVSSPADIRRPFFAPGVVSSKRGRVLNRAVPEEARR